MDGLANNHIGFKTIIVSICLSKVFNPGYVNVNSEVMFCVAKQKEKGKKKVMG